MKGNNNNLSLQEPKLPSVLDDARRNHGGMTVPEGFFESFEQKMNAVIDADVLAHQSPDQPVLVPQTKQTKRSSRRWINIAAAALLIVVVAAALRFDWSFESAPSPKTPLVGTITEVDAGSDVDPLSVDVQETLVDEMLADVSDYEVYEMFCDI